MPFFSSVGEQAIFLLNLNRTLSGLSTKPTLHIFFMIPFHMFSFLFATCSIFHTVFVFIIIPLVFFSAFCTVFFCVCACVCTVSWILLPNIAICSGPRHAYDSMDYIHISFNCLDLSVSLFQSRSLINVQANSEQMYVYWELYSLWYSLHFSDYLLKLSNRRYFDLRIK